MLGKLTQPLIVGLTGQKGHGKDTAAQALYAFGFKRFNFADGVKVCIAEMLGCTLEQLEDPVFKESVHAPSGKTYREWMQKLGTEFGREMWADVWIERWKRTVRNTDHEKIVCTDLRFPNELLAIEKVSRGTACTIRVHRPGADVDTSHESEAHVQSLGVEYVIENDSTVESLWQRVIGVVAQHAESIK